MHKTHRLSRLDDTVAGSAKTTGVSGNAAHIHMGAKGSKGPVIAP